MLARLDRVTRSEVAVIGGLAMAKVALHLATNAQYDFHRDSLYYLDSARHPAWGYVDYPPITPMVARLSLWLFGPSVWGLRLWPSLAGAVIGPAVGSLPEKVGEEDQPRQAQAQPRPWRGRG